MRQDIIERPYRDQLVAHTTLYQRYTGHGKAKNPFYTLSNAVADLITTARIVWWDFVPAAIRNQRIQAGHDRDRGIEIVGPQSVTSFCIFT